MRMSSELQDRLVQTATATGLALVLALLALASPTPALAEGVDTLSACVAASVNLL
jgi:NitT/TauT family transport system substrate-binding protein